MTIPFWTLAFLIFGLRIVDVSIGTIRTIAVVQGRIKISVLPGFFEVLVWLVAVSQVLGQVTTNPMLMVVYSAGFAGGNAVGILLDRKMALGGVILRIISVTSGDRLADVLGKQALRVTTFEGQEENGPVTLLYVVCKRRELQELLASARDLDPDLFFAVEPFRESSFDLGHPLPHPTGWRAVRKKK